MSNIFLIIIAILHGGQFIVSSFKGDFSVSIMMLGFTVADIGILLAAR